MITGIHVSSSEMVINKDIGKKETAPKFVKNQLIHAKVLQQLPGGRAQLLVNGKKIMAKTAMLLKPGEDIQLKVMAEKDSVVLKLVGPLQKMTLPQVSSLLRFFSKNESIPDITRSQIPHVKDLITDLALKSDKADHDFLPRLLEKSGLVWETKVARTLLDNTASQEKKMHLDLLLKQDIKGTLLKELFSGDSMKPDAAKTVAAFSETVENFQLLNHQSSDTGKFLLPFPVLSESAFRFGQLLIDTGDKSDSDQKDAEKLIHISFLLDMTHLGPLRADFSILKKAITGRFLVSDDDTRDYIKSKIPELKTRLTSVEYEAHLIECETVKKEEIQENSLAQSLVKERDDCVLSIVI